MTQRGFASVRKYLTNESGQLFLISVLLLVVLVLSVGTVVFMNQSGARSGVASLNRSHALGATQEGLAYATHVLATSSATWQNALAGNFPSEFTDGTSPHVYSDSAGGIFTIRCSAGGTLQSYEVQVLIQGGALDKTSGQPAYSKALQAVLSQKTLAVALPTEVQAGAALVVMHVPQISPANGLQTDWGPIVSYASDSWTVTGLMDAQQYPRKFSEGAITGTSFLRSLDPSNPNNTDQEEYWANSSLGFPSMIDLTSYQALAQTTFGVIGATCTVSANCTANPLGSGFYPDVSNDTATFQGGWSAPVSSAIVYINGNVDFEDIAIDLKNTGAFIINGNLTLGSPLLRGIASNAIRVPNTAAQEYYYQPSQCPCSTAIGQTCTVAQATRGASNYIQYRGFLYVTGNLIVPGNNYWVLDGAVRVDGQIQVSASSTLQILYDDQINRNILVTPVDLMIDSLATVPLS